MATSTAATVAGSNGTPSTPCSTTKVRLLTTTPLAPTTENRLSRRQRWSLRIVLP
jgi:hypothetical protein